MKNHANRTVATLIMIALLANLNAQDTSDHSAHQTEQTKTIKMLEELKAKLDNLEATINKRTMPNTDNGNMQGINMDKSGSTDMSSKKSMQGMSMEKNDMKMGKMKNMSMDKDSSTSTMDMNDNDTMQEMSMGGMGMGMMDMGKMKSMKMMGMMNMGKMKNMKMMGSMGNDSVTTSSLPGFPGASHIYHIGSTDFFIDHSNHLNLTHEQKTKLNKIKEATTLSKSDTDRKIEQAEQELWILTSNDKPDLSKIEEKIKHIESLNSAKRLNYIKAVGQAATTLNENQIEKLMGNSKAEDQAQSDSTPDHSNH